jgi:peroxiredoxin
MLEIGSVAPALDLEDTEGNPVSVRDAASSLHRTGVLLFFMRSATCPVCNLHVKHLVRDADEYAAAGVQVMIALPEGREEAARWKAKQSVPFVVVTGRRGSAHEAVGLTRKVFGSMRQSGSILVDSHNRIRHAHAATVPTSSFDSKGVAAAVGQLRATLTA